jgi:hypothetical protein
MKEILKIEKKEQICVGELCDPFFKDKDRMDEFGLGNLYDLSILGKNWKFVFKGFRVLKNNENLNRCFHLYLTEKGYIPDNNIPKYEDITILFTGSEFKGQRLREWLKYSHPQKEDLWVNYFGFESPADGAWLDIAITNTPEKIRNIKDTQTAVAFDRALIKLN